MNMIWFKYDAEGSLLREGSKTYRYGYLDKVMSVTDGDTTRTFTYHADGQLASANYGDASESFVWDGLALIQRGDEQFVNEPHVGGGNPVASSKGTSYFNDMLGTTVGSKSNGKYSAAALTAFGENHPTTEPPNHQTFYTGKPYVEGLGHAFWMRNYRAGLAKWQTADPMGYPDGWNALEYGVNSPWSGFDRYGAAWGNIDFVIHYFDSDPNRDNYVDTDMMGLTDNILPIVRSAAENKIDSIVKTLIMSSNQGSGSNSTSIDSPFPVACGSVVWAMGDGTGRAVGDATYSWGTERFWYADHLYERMWYSWQFKGRLIYSDDFKDPTDTLNVIDWDMEVPFGRPYSYGHIWLEQIIDGGGYIWARMIE